MKYRSYLTISVDDGHPTDLKTADILAATGLKATFYVPAHNAERALVSPAELRKIAADFEIGSHTYNHRRLADLSPTEALREIQHGKSWLEDQLSKPVVSFCYPGGKYNSTVTSLVEQVGFAGARTCKLNVNTMPAGRFSWGVSTHAIAHSPVVQVRHALMEANFVGLRNYLLLHRCAIDWERQFVASMDWVEANGGIAHLFLHSWEIDERQAWDKLERVLKHASNRSFTLATNGELFQAWHNNGRKHHQSRILGNR